MNDISVIIGTCDLYSYLWKNFDILFKRYWKLNTKNYLISETLDYDNNLYNVIKPGKISWGERILKTLDKVDTKYVFFILDDYYLSELFTEELIKEHISILEEFNADKIMLDIDYGEPTYYLNHIRDNLYKFDRRSDYLNSVQPSIWKKEYLMRVLKSHYSPWDFETVGNKYTQSINPLILLNVRKEHMYFNFVRKGNILSEGWENFLKKENLL